jgi:hypothetical protein
MRGIAATTAAAAFILVPAATASPPNACRLLKSAEVAKLLGMPRASTLSGTGGASSSCVWTGQGTETHPLVTLQVTDGVSRQDYEYIFRHLPGAVRVGRIGEYAFRYESVLDVYARGHGLKLTSVHVQSPIAVEKKMALLALPRLA